LRSPALGFDSPFNAALAAFSDIPQLTYCQTAKVGVVMIDLQFAPLMMAEAIGHATAKGRLRNMARKEDDGRVR
jgi:hypothetical protein